MHEKERFTEEQIIASLKEQTPGRSRLCRKLGVSQHTFYRWRSSTGMEVTTPQAEALKEENRH